MFKSERAELRKTLFKIPKSCAPHVSGYLRRDTLFKYESIREK